MEAHCVKRSPWASLIEGYPPTSGLRVTIVCERCRHRHLMERHVYMAGPLYAVCHECELPMRSELTAEYIAGTGLTVA